MIAQCAAVLFSRPPSLRGVEPYLRQLASVSRLQAADDAYWADGQGSLVVELDGWCRVEVDAVSRPWPDPMGDPHEDPLLYAAYRAGAFGPHAWPGQLERALQQAWHFKRARWQVPGHGGFLRLRIQATEQRDPVRELMALTQVAERILRDAVGPVAWFHPAGEVLQEPQAVIDGLKQMGPAALVGPMDLWVGLRLHQASGGLAVVDTAGMGALQRPDLEAVYVDEAHSNEEIKAFLRNLCVYLVDRGDVLKDGDGIQGPGGGWRVQRMSSSLVQPDRAVVRLSPSLSSTPAPAPR